MSDLQSPRDGLDVGSRPAGTWPWVALLACAVVICGYVGNALAVLGPRLPGHFGISMESLGLLFGAPLLAAIIPYAIAGPASDRWGAKTTLLVALWGVAFSFALCGAGKRLGPFAAGVLMAGLFNAAIFVCFPAYLARLHPNSHRRMFSLSLTASALPWLVFPLLVGRLMTRFPDHFGRVLHGPFLVGAMLMAGAATLFRRAPSDGPGAGHPPKDRPGFMSALKLVGRRPMLLVVLLAAVHGVSDGVFATWFPVYATCQFGEALRRPGDVLALCGLAYTSSRLMLWLLPEGRGQRLLLVAPGLVGGTLLMACLWINDARLMFWGYPLAAFAWSWEYPTLVSEAARLAPRHFASFLSILTIFSQLVQAALMPVVGAFFRWAQEAGPAAPWWQRDLRVPMAIFPLGFLAFGLVAAASGLGTGALAGPEGKPDGDAIAAP